MTSIEFDHKEALGGPRRETGQLVSVKVTFLFTHPDSKSKVSIYITFQTFHHKIHYIKLLSHLDISRLTSHSGFGLTENVSNTVKRKTKYCT